MNDLDLAEIGSKLMARQAELLEDSDNAEQARDTVMLDQQSVGRLSRMDALQVQAMAQAQQRNRAHELQRIEQALLRLEGENFGLCLECEEEIAPKRIMADPSILLCLSCAQSRD